MFDADEDTEHDLALLLAGICSAQAKPLDPNML